ncbi:C-type lectin 37Db-like [Armigeres subalbatus]|uniref:C-type lectin 37Db-like n=1 Tax=Armigeres subalbatus TaxID=124917 RepID=UPI002ED0F1F2
MSLLSAFLLFCVINTAQYAGAELLGNQTVRDILAKNKCLCRCDAIDDGSKNYLIPFDDGTWFEAISYCHEQGMSLAQIRDRRDHQDLEEWLRDNGDGPSESYWIGGNDLAKPGIFYWGLTGKEIRYKQWASGEPNMAVMRGEKEHCVELRADTMKWNDSVCSKRLKFVCERFN